MIPIIQRETCEKKKWIKNDEILDIIAISESTPGPIAINAATYIGYKVMGFWGSFFATLGLIIPSFVIIYIISFFYESFMAFGIIQAAFKGLSVGVIILLLNALFKLKKSVKFNFISILLFSIVLILSLLNVLLKVNINNSSLIFIGLGIVVGIVTSFIDKKETKK